MRVFTCSDFSGHYPVGVAAVLVGESEEDVREEFAAILAGVGLRLRGDETFIELDTTRQNVRVLCDGDY